MANQWFRMYAEFATDPKVQTLSETFQRRYIMLLCFRCNVNSNDVVTLHEALTDEYIAFQLRISNEEWQETKQMLLTKNLIDEHNLPVNWDKRQYISDSSAERVRRYREKKKQECNNCNVTVTPPDAEAETDTEIPTTTFIAPVGKFRMLADWWPVSEGWKSQVKINQLKDFETTQESLEESVKEFVSHWITTCDEYDQAKWEQKLARSIFKNRRFTEAKNAASKRSGKESCIGKSTNEPRIPIIEQAKQACGKWVQQRSEPIDITPKNNGDPDGGSEGVNQSVLGANDGEIFDQVD